MLKTIFGLLLLALFSCNGSRIVHSWQAANTPSAVYNKILVMAVLKDSDTTLGQKMEYHIAGDLAARGYTAVSAAAQFGRKYFEGLPEEQAFEKLTFSGFDAVITVVMLDKNRESYYVPEHINQSPYGMYQDRVWNYYNTMSTRISTSGYYQVDTKYFWESNLYDMKLKKLVASIQTKSFNPENAESMSHEYGALIINKMAGLGVLK